MRDEIEIIHLSEPVFIRQEECEGLVSSEVIFKNIKIGRDDYYDKFNDVPYIKIGLMKKRAGLPELEGDWRTRGQVPIKSKQKDMWDYYV